MRPRIGVPATTTTAGAFPRMGDSGHFIGHAKVNAAHPKGSPMRLWIPVSAALATIAALLAGPVLPATPAAAAAPAPGDSTTAAAVLSTLVVSADRTATYDRSFFQHWVDADGDGCDTRSEVLQAESAVPVTFGSGCTVATGQWTSWYDGATWTNASDVDIDHFVPLAEAWRSGAAGWSADQRRDYANDLGYDGTLVAVTDNVNQSKSDDDVAHWLPPLASAHCTYAVDWVLVKFRWNLTVDPTERTALDGLLTGACGDTAVTAPQKGTAPTATPAAAGVNRIAGSDRYQVAVNVSKNFPSGVPVVYVAKGTDYPDALAAGPAAAKEGGPVLLVTPTTVPSAVEQELQRLQPQKIVVVGGTASVTPAVYDRLSVLAPSITRIDGGDRYAVSRALVQYAFGTSGVSRLYVTTGANYPDALSASPAAGTRGGAVLQVNGAATTLDAGTTALIQSLHPTDIAIAGGPNSVSPAVEQALWGAGAPNGVIRLSGSDRFEASETINHDTFTSATQVFIATGLNFPDALAGGAFAARVHAPLYVVPGSCVPQSTLADIQALNPAQLTILGGPNSVGAGVESLTPCINPLSGSLSPSCSPSQVTLTATNPNPFAVAVSVDVDGAGNRSFTVPAWSTNSSVLTPGEDTTHTFALRSIQDGRVFFAQTYKTNCVADAPPPPAPPAPPGNPGNSVNCTDFPDWPSAQAWFDRYFPYFGDVAQLDSDHDGIACESLPGAH